MEFGKRKIRKLKIIDSRDEACGWTWRKESISPASGSIEGFPSRRHFLKPSHLNYKERIQFLMDLNILSKKDT